MITTIVILSSLLMVMLLIAKVGHSIIEKLQTTNNNYWGLAQKAYVTISKLEEEIAQKNWRIEKFEEDLHACHCRMDVMMKEIKKYKAMNPDKAQIERAVLRDYICYNCVDYDTESDTNSPCARCQEFSHFLPKNRFMDYLYKQIRVANEDERQDEQCVAQE